MKPLHHLLLIIFFLQSCNSNSTIEEETILIAFDIMSDIHVPYVISFIDHSKNELVPIADLKGSKKIMEVGEKALIKLKIKSSKESTKLLLQAQPAENTGSTAKPITHIIEVKNEDIVRWNIFDYPIVTNPADEAKDCSNSPLVKKYEEIMAESENGCNYCIDCALLAFWICNNQPNMIENYQRKLEEAIGRNESIVCEDLL
jgi:hypothetical protein